MVGTLIVSVPEFRSKAVLFCPGYMAHIVPKNTMNERESLQPYPTGCCFK
ncbi:MAG: hypothetical protein WC502_00580 [Methanolinea sp.]